MWHLVRSYKANKELVRTNTQFKEFLVDVEAYGIYHRIPNKQQPITINQLMATMVDMWPRLDEGQRHAVERVIWDTFGGTSFQQIIKLVKELP